jgi:hypothetical protein
MCVKIPRSSYFQIVTFPQLGLLHQPEMDKMLRQAFKMGVDVMGQRKQS